jgi:UDP-glucuronate 4-epimerase
MTTTLITGIAGFIGSWTAEALLARGETVIGLDNFNDYYDVSLKRARVKKFGKQIPVISCDITDFANLQTIFKKNKIDRVCHLAAQAGLRKCQ